jgi:hypothetical protein
MPTKRESACGATTLATRAFVPLLLAQVKVLLEMPSAPQSLYFRFRPAAEATVAEMASRAPHRRRVFFIVASRE